MFPILHRIFSTTFPPKTKIVHQKIQDKILVGGAFKTNFKTKTTVIQNGDFVEILSRYGGESPVPTKKNHQKKWDFLIKNNMPIMQNNH